MRLRLRCSDDDNNGGDGFLKTRVSRQKPSSKEEDERPLNRFYGSKKRPTGPVKTRCENVTVHLLTQLKWRKAQIHIMVQFNGHISDLSIQQNGRAIILLQKELINHKATKGYLTRSITTRSLWKELENLKNNRDISRIKNDNSEDNNSFHYKWLQKI